MPLFLPLANCFDYFRSLKYFSIVLSDKKYMSTKLSIVNSLSLFYAALLGVGSLSHFASA